MWRSLLFFERQEMVFQSGLLVEVEDVFGSTLTFSDNFLVDQAKSYCSVFN